MISTKNISIETSGVKPVIEVGNRVVKINDIRIDAMPYDQNAYNVYLFLETEPVGNDFQGFLKDPKNPASPRYLGQVGRARLSAYPFASTVLPDGRKINHEVEIGKAFAILANAVGKRDELDEIQAENVFDFVDKAKRILVNSGYFNICLGGKEWRNEAGYINHDLFVPKSNKYNSSVTALGVDVMPFNEQYHIKKLKETTPSSSNFETVSSGSDFDL